MTIAWIEAGLRQISKSFRRILCADADVIVGEAIAELQATKQLYDRRRRRTDDRNLRVVPWGYQIRPQRPLQFRPTDCNGIRLSADVYCSVLWEDAATPPVWQNVHLRVWSEDIGHSYREEWDSDCVLEKLTDPDRSDSRRVILRCHFDLANAQQLGPRYHLQFGGNAREEELCWFPNMGLPRLPHPPMDLVLTCQLIAANFYWEQYNVVREKPEWRLALQGSQQHLLLGYYQDCVRALSDNTNLLDHLWNT